MAQSIIVRIEPENPLTRTVTQSLYARLIYTREIPVVDDDPAAPKTQKLPASVRVELDEDTGKAEVGVEDHAAGTLPELQVETAQGTVLFESGPVKVGGNPVSGEVKIPVAVFDAAVGRAAPSAAAVLGRSGRFVTFSDAMPDFSGCRLYVAPIRPSTRDDGSANPQIQASRDFLGIGGSGEITDFETKKVQPGAQQPKAVNALGFQTAMVRADGTFEISVDIEGDETAWLWWLVGSESFAGYQLEEVPTRPRRNIVILLPEGASDGTPPVNGNGTGTGDVSGGNGVGSPSLDFDEATVVANPDQFADDPGTHCSPFENPQRILGERRFFTILRIDQPEVSGRGSLKVSRPIVLDLAPPLRLSTLNASLGDNVGRATLSSSSLMRLNFASAAAPAFDLRRDLEANIFKPNRNNWVRWVTDRTRGRVPVSAEDPIEWEGDPSIYQAATVAGGHVLEWRVQWRSNGYSLGDVSHTLTLAPRQTKRIAKLSWRRREEARRTEETQVSDALTQVTNRERDYSDAVSASLSEWSKGGSKSRSTGVAGGVGFAMGPVVIGGGAAHGRASSSSWQRGGRRVAASEQQNLRDAIRQYGESVRRLESTVVTEVTQEEEVEGVSETLRNVNYCHALTVLYYEILRHLRVDTGFAGVRECLFVPFSITPFDIDKALKWRDKLRQGMLDRSLRWALDRLDEVASAWANSDIPPGRRSQHPINYVTGSVYVQLSIERPREQEEEEAIEAYYNLWTPMAPILGIPVRRIVARMQENVADRDRFYQAEVAPTMASKWADRLEFELNGTTLSGADFTLSTRYRFGRTVRIDFTLPVNSNLTREDLQQIRVKTAQELPAGSVANLQRMTLHYYTDHFDRQVSSDRGARDLIDPGTGQADSNGADAIFPLSRWEQQDLRNVIEDAVARLIVHLNANMVYYHKVIWWLMDRDEIYMMLDGFTAPYGRRFEDGKWVDDTGRSLASVVERDPMAILGNTLVFRVAAGAFLGIDGHESPEAAHRYYFDSQVRADPLRLSLPTEGLYAQALMDKCNACEEHAGSTDWVLTQEDPELESIADQLSTRRSASEGLAPTNLPDTIISLQNAPTAPAPQGFGDLLSTLGKSDSFRDMAGLAGTQAAAQAALSQAASLASGFGQKALDLQKAKMGADDAKKKLDNIKKAEEKGLIDKPEAKKQASKVLDQQNTDPAAIPLTKEESIKKAVDNASAGGKPIEVSRQTKDGSETVKVGETEDAGTIQRNFIIERDDLNSQTRAFSPQTHDISGVTTFSVRVRQTENLPDDAFIRWSVPPAEAGDYTLAGGSTTQVGSSVAVTGLRPGRSNLDVALRTPDGTVHESVKYPLSIPQFVTVDVDAGTFNPVLTGMGLAVAQEREEVLEEARRVCLTVLNTANVRTVWRMAPFNEALPAQFAAGGAAAANVTAATIRGNPPSHALYGRTRANAGGIGPNDFDETIDVWPGAFADAVAGNANENVDELTNSVVGVIQASALSSSTEKSFAIRVLGRLVGETLAHEIIHSLIGSVLTAGFHNAGPGLESDIMNRGIDRSFTARTGFEIDQTAIAGGDLTQIITHDRGIVFINIPTGTAQAELDRHFPVPPRFR